MVSHLKIPSTLTKDYKIENHLIAVQLRQFIGKSSGNKGTQIFIVRS